MTYSAAILHFRPWVSFLWDDYGLFSDTVFHISVIFIPTSDFRVETSFTVVLWSVLTSVSFNVIFHLENKHGDLGFLLFLCDYSWRKKIIYKNRRFKSTGSTCVGEVCPRVAFFIIQSHAYTFHLVCKLF